jgi:hypothetical protein
MHKAYGYVALDLVFLEVVDLFVGNDECPLLHPVEHVDLLHLVREKHSLY